MIRNKFRCPTCSKDISKSNYTKHTEACSRPKPPKKIRGIDYDPNGGYKQGNRQAWNKGLTKQSHPSVNKQAETLIQMYQTGQLIVKGYRAWTPEQCRENAKLHKTGGYREKAGRSKKFKVADSFGKMVCLQSSYELLCSQILDKLQIKWIRPSYLRYGEKKYYPDFYLVDYEIYLDPKNDYLIKKDKPKIESASLENKVKIYMLSQEQITESYIQKLINSPIV